LSLDRSNTVARQIFDLVADPPEDFGGAVDDGLHQAVQHGFRLVPQPEGLQARWVNITNERGSS
jgi:hypothetical protein